jgi:hypothetical protein
MTDPNDNLASVADPGAMDPDSVTEPDNDLAGDLTYDEVHHAEQEPGVPGQTPDSPTAQGSPVGPPD